MIERFLELQPTVYAALVTKEVRSNASDISLLLEEDVILAEDITNCVIRLREITKTRSSEEIHTKKLLSMALAAQENDFAIVR
ncbi:hypothetical protein CHS0354_030653 [Potamilus streckersoni]|uniref:Uncharacterized protein n=1 Tax=Potamilus streckersoni TaxID=2493646 RepID=A0AAE0VKV9_9BIVA|nr:hypothetical protein CHS0354_030653 [Potamilus streckersoni]